MIMRMRRQRRFRIVDRPILFTESNANLSIHVVAIEDDPQYRSSLELLFSRTSDFELVDSFGSPAAALARLDNDRSTPGWDLVLMDVDLPGMNGIDCTRSIKQRLPDTAVVVLTVFEERATIVAAICAGADGYLLKHTSAADLLTQLRAIAMGGAPLSAGVARTVLDLVRRVGPVATDDPDQAGGTDRLGLTDRELDVLRCLVEGMSYKRTAQQLGISIDTVRSYIRSVYSTLQVHNVAEAVSRALREGIV
jgi:DNA-binding NarL/FixJ family response regulator